MTYSKGKRRRFAVIGAAVALLLAGSAALVATGPDAGAAKPPAVGYFYTNGVPAPAGAALPTEAQCAGQVHRSTWEPRAENNTANHTTPPSSYHVGRNDSDWNATWHTKYWPRITGNFVGTTDEILQWAACKWGLPDNFLRAEAVQESSWRQSAEGDVNGSGTNCITGDNRSPCPTSFGITQIKWYYHPPIKPSTSSGSGWPYIRTSTAFNVDLFGAEIRGCLDNMRQWGGNSTNDLWGCSQTWYQGSYTPGGGSYSNNVKSIMASRPWLNWADQGGGTTPPTQATTTTKAPTTTTTQVPVSTTSQPISSTTTTTKPATTTTTTQPPPPEPGNVLYLCINAEGNVQYRRMGTSPRPCANPTDRHITVQFAWLP